MTSSFKDYGTILPAHHPNGVPHLDEHKDGALLPPMSVAEGSDNDDERSLGSLADRMREYVHAGPHLSVRDMEGDATVPNQIFNLIKNIVGAGVLALPSGVAAFADAPSAVVPASVCTILMGAIFGYYFLLIGRACHLSGAATYRELWEDTMGDTGAVAVSAVNMLKPALGNLAYSMILADTFRSLFATLGVVCTRTQALILITVVALLPLCLLKNLRVLAPFSIMGIVGISLTAVIMGIRCFDGTYDTERDGRFVQDLPERFRPSFGGTSSGASGAWALRILVLVCMLFEAYVCHYNSPRFYTELKDRTVPRFRSVVSYAFGASGLIYIMMTTFGFLTFGANCDGYILNNYSTNDPLATFCRSAIAFAIVFTYPVVFFGYRDGVLDLLHVPIEDQTAHYLDLLTVTLLAIVTVIAVFVHDLGMLNAVGGGTIATIIVFVLPTYMYRSALYRHYDDEPPKAELVEVQFTMALMWLGIVMGTIGVWIAI